MAESTLSLDWDDLKEAVGYFLGYGSSSGDWTTAQESEIEGIVHTGYRRTLYPTAGGAGYEWSFLRPTTTLAIEADDGDYDLPDDFGRMVGDFHYAPDEYKASIVIISLAMLLDMRSHSDRNAYPNFAAIRFKSSDGSTGQRQEVLFYPEPDDDYTLYYAYDAYTGALSDDAPYPLGGMQMSELYKESCLAVAESRNNDEIGLHNQIFQALLIDAIARDKKRGAQNYGRMGQPAEADEKVFRRGNKLYDGAYEIQYDGEYI